MYSLKYLSVFGFQGTVINCFAVDNSHFLKLLRVLFASKHGNAIDTRFANVDLINIQFCILINGDGEIRTLDPLLARQVLSQLSYAPVVTTSNAYCFFLLINPAATCSPISSPT